LIAIDTNLLVYAHRRDSRWHVPAVQLIESLANGRDAWAIPWPCIHEFYAIATHPRLYARPSTPAQALDQWHAWRDSPSLMLLAEDEAYWPALESIIDRSRVVGPAIHDARIAALCLRHGVHELLTADRDLSRFAGLVTRNPLPGA
jgi:hypothetical protein